MSGPDLSNYVEVHERIEAFYKKHPEGSLQSSWSLHEIAGAPTIVVEARAYRGAEDERPGVGLASEPVPGNTPYTKDSELMNAETSAWGRALAALGFEVKRGIASGNEVRSRQGGGGSAGNGAVKVSPKQLEFFESLVKEAGSTGEGLSKLMAWASENLTGGKKGSMSKAIDGLKKDKAATCDRLEEAAREWAESRSDTTPEPYESSDAPDKADGTNVPF